MTEVKCNCYFCEFNIDGEECSLDNLTLKCEHAVIICSNYHTDPDLFKKYLQESN